MKRVKIVFLVSISILLGCNKDEAPPKVNAPTKVSLIVVSYSGIMISWEDNSTNETGFLVERSEDNLNFSKVAIVNTDITSYTDDGLKAETKYYYRISCLIEKLASDYAFGSQKTRAKTMEEKIAGVWKFNAVFYDNKVINMDDCAKDDTWEIKQNKDFEMRDNDLFCGQAGENDFTGIWVLTADKTKIRFILENGHYLILIIKELKESTLQLTNKGKDRETTFSFVK